MPSLSQGADKYPEGVPVSQNPPFPPPPRPDEPDDKQGLGLRMSSTSSSTKQKYSTIFEKMFDCSTKVRLGETQSSATRGNKRSQQPALASFIYKYSVQ